MLTKEQIDGMVKDACDCELVYAEFDVPMGELILDLCCHVKSLACEIEDLRERLGVRACECCGDDYFPMCEDSVRCTTCTMECHRPHGSDWIRGKHCPSRKQVVR